ncbi:hypothetical protein FGO68_gene14191 [Halteria grandinella]|uniref:N-acetyltransferase domain-containing protein n=1 Tax=Halteria grandinella TaxID=5974 RepID=A0A8J8SZ62_HALGN|nr:hypothetical protein FGO68_gene14191 [Halteria grandinella]
MLSPSKTQERGVLHETDAYLFRYPETEDEIIDHENVLVGSRFSGNPQYVLMEISRETIARISFLERDQEISNQQRIAVFDKSTGTICGAFGVSRLDQEVSIPDFNVKFSHDPAILRMYEHYYQLEHSLKMTYPKYFQDLSKICVMHAFAVAPEYRGRGIATLMNEVSIKRAKELGCKYMIAFMVSPETQHIGRKYGFQLLVEQGYERDGLYDQLMLEKKGQEFSERQLKKIEEIKDKFNGREPIYQAVLLTLDDSSS